VPTAVYSAVADATHRSEVLLARSDRRMTSWVQDHKSVARQPADDGISHVRDPYVFTVDRHRYAIQGAGHLTGRGRIVVHGCDDLTSWTFLGDFLTSDDPIAGRLAPANIWECPNLVRFDDRWVLIVSLWARHGDATRLSGVRYLVGDLEVGPHGPRFTPTGGGLLDDGPCCYAPQALALPDRTLLWAWSWELGRSAEEIERAGWAGALTFCRELSLDGDVLVSRPAPELDALRVAPLEVTSGEPFVASAYDCLLPPAARRLTLALVDVGGVERIVVERALPADPRKAPRLLVDGSMIELFDGGPTAYTARAYPTTASRWVLHLDSPAPIRAWRLGLD